MGSEEPKQIPVYVVVWRPLPNIPGRKHMAVFIPNTAVADVDPLSGNSCTGTIYNVRGEASFRYVRQFQRNWDNSETKELESATRIGSIAQQHVYDPANDGVVSHQVEDTVQRCRLDGVALTVPPPEPPVRLWVAVC